MAPSPILKAEFLQGRQHLVCDAPSRIVKATERGNQEAAHPGRLGCQEPIETVLDGQAMCGGNTQVGSGADVYRRVRLAMAVILSGPHQFELIVDVEVPEE
jgi:hypothetical protein